MVPLELKNLNDVEIKSEIRKWEQIQANVHYVCHICTV